MTNTALFLALIDAYERLAYTHDYIFGFRFGGNVYMAYADATMLPAILKLDKGSRGQGYSLRYVPNKAIKMALMAKAEIICSVDYFEGLVADSKYNRGEIFEKLVTEKFGQTWIKDNIPYTMAGDIEGDGKAYQIKYEKATFTNEKTIYLQRSSWIPAS